jgi:hypothetical protein
MQTYATAPSRNATRNAPARQAASPAPAAPPARQAAKRKGSTKPGKVKC